TMIETEGVVSVPPGVLGDRIMYLAGSGIQVYLPSADVAELPVGSRVHLIAQRSSYQSEARLKIATVTDLQILPTLGPSPEPHVVKTGDIGEANEGWLVKIRGTVSKTNGNTFYVNDGSGEAKVVIKDTTEIDKPEMKQGVAAAVTGIVSRTYSGYRILPRFSDDLVVGRVAGAKITRFPATGDRLLTTLLAVAS